MSGVADQRWAGIPAEAAARLRPAVERIAAGAVARETARDLPFAAIADLRAAGLTVARLPGAEGGLGLDWPAFGRALIAVAAADAHLPQILRGHFAIAEEALTTTDAAFRDRWRRKLADGAIVGNSWSERGGNALGRSDTALATGPDGILRITGQKYYTTGSLFGGWTDTVAHRLADGTEVAALVRLDQPGVEVRDDGDGFGQRLTGTGTIVFDGAVVEAVDVLPVAERCGYQTAQFQFTLLAVLAGIADAAVAEAAEAVRARTRVYSHGGAARAQDDAQIQALIGELSASAFAVRATVLAVADALEDAHRAALVARDAPGDAALADAARRAAGLAEIRAAQAQSFATGQTQLIASRLFDALGASATSTAAALDRHWRNARTVSSHNPVLYKNRWIGDWVLHGTLPNPLWAVGTPASPAP